MNSQSKQTIAVAGGGPAGLIAALCLRKLGRDVVLFDRDTHPRYRVGESLLPGTLSILHRLGLKDKLESANFPKKYSATFVWGNTENPLTFSFATHKTNPWTYDYAYQVTRAEFDHILLDAAREAGVDVRENCRVTKIHPGDKNEYARVLWQTPESQGELEIPWVIDATGKTGLLAQPSKSRQYDKYYKHVAVWSYFKGGKRFSGDLEGNTITLTTRNGWIWLIPLKDDIYSVGLITSPDNAAQIKSSGLESFYRSNLNISAEAMNILDGARPCADVRITRDWSYDTSLFTTGRAFACGDAACFIDPLFSQGVHLAAYSGKLAAAGIDHLIDQSENQIAVQSWYKTAYQNAYERYHMFLSTFYTMAKPEDSDFWEHYQHRGESDERLESNNWYRQLKDSASAHSRSTAEALQKRSSILRELWQHDSAALDDSFDENQLALKRIKWASDLTKTLRKINHFRWNGNQVLLQPFFTVGATSFELEPVYHLSNGSEKTLFGVSANTGHKGLFESLIESPANFVEIKKRLKAVESGGNAVQLVSRLLDVGLLQAFDSDGKLIAVKSALRFGGVGADDDLS